NCSSVVSGAGVILLRVNSCEMRRSISPACSGVVAACFHISAEMSPEGKPSAAFFAWAWLGGSAVRRAAVGASTPRALSRPKASTGRQRARVAAAKHEYTGTLRILGRTFDLLRGTGETLVPRGQSAPSRSGHENDLTHATPAKARGNEDEKSM